jgi:hypothetical protein
MNRRNLLNRVAALTRFAPKFCRSFSRHLRVESVKVMQALLGRSTRRLRGTDMA